MKDNKFSDDDIEAAILGMKESIGNWTPELIQNYISFRQWICLENIAAELESRGREASMLKALKAAKPVLVEANEKWSNGEDCYESALTLVENEINKINVTES